MGSDAMILVFWMLSFKPSFSFYPFIFIRRCFSSSLLSVLTVVSSVYMRLLIFLPIILIPACASSSLTLHMMYSAYKLNKQGDNIQPWHTPFPIWNQSIVPCLVLTDAFWLAYSFLRRQVRCSDILMSLRIFHRQRNQRSNCQHRLAHRESKGIAEKHLPLFHCLFQNQLEHLEVLCSHNAEV